MFYIVVILAILWTCHVGMAEIFGDYVGYTACGDCHDDVVDGWEKTGHAKAFENLAKQGPEKQSIPECVRCHVVAYEKDGGFIDMELTPELKGVQCESCHGPGRAHVESDGDASKIVGRPGEDLCRACHTEGQDKDFNYEKKKALVHGAP
ncbi:MAG: cytochrome C554 [Deltaproteobacteria bacterium]|nr:cytochrome C554 [Deltaproteobacteria bacterium]